MAFFTVAVHGGEEASAALNAFLARHQVGLSWAGPWARAVVRFGAGLWEVKL